MRKYITEFIGTFFLVLVVALTGNAAAIGVTLMVMIFAGGHVSGAHYNPAVTLAVLIRGKISSREAIAYMVVQIFAAIVAALIAKWYMADMGVATMDLSGKVVKAFTSELIGTFALAYVVLNVATSKGTIGNNFYGLAIGLTVFAMASTFGSISGGAFNPAVAIGATVVKAFALKNIWIYLIACFGGSFLAALVFNFINQEDKHVPPLVKS
ncbi:MAG TPA: aquaporin [Chitinophagaceae bacterium]|jgi:aquaporin Z|nr:aquaporin [Chitinophagaceae bacterium]